MQWLLQGRVIAVQRLDSLEGVTGERWLVYVQCYDRGGRPSPATGAPILVVLEAGVAPPPRSAWVEMLNPEFATRHLSPPQACLAAGWKALGRDAARTQVYRGLIRRQLQRPEYRNDGKYQFVTWITGGGAEACVHLTADEVGARAAERLGPGKLVDDGTDLWWEQMPDAILQSRGDDESA